MALMDKAKLLVIAWLFHLPNTDNIRSDEREMSSSILNKKIGWLKVRDEVIENGRKTYICDCACGNRIKLTEEKLLEDKLTSCGCLENKGMILSRGYISVDGEHGRIRDLAWLKFGKLTVIRPTEFRSKRGYVYWYCECECGNTAIVDMQRIISNKYISCGCSIQKDRAGLKIGQLEVIRYTGKENAHGDRLWLCRCSCGKEVVVSSGEMRKKGEDISCGHDKIANRERLIAKQFGLLTVIKAVGKDKHNNLLWECECKCGRRKVVAGVNLVTHKTKTCGDYWCKQELKTINQ